MIPWGMAAEANSNPIHEIQIKSDSDQFTLKKVGAHWQLNTKVIDLGPLKPFLPLLKAELMEACPELPKKPDFKQHYR